MLNSGPSACQLVTDFISDMEKDIVNQSDHLSNDYTNRIPLAPHVHIKIAGTNVWALIDTGSQVTAVSENFYEKKKKIELFLSYLYRT